MPIGNGAVLIGMGERITAQAIGQLARNLFSKGSAEQIIVAQFPREHAYMHLDTVFTFCDRDLVTFYPPVVDRIQAFTIRPGTSPDGLLIQRESRPFVEVVAEALKLYRLRQVTTGGDTFEAEREQWEDGNNVLALEPGVVIAYEHDDYTNAKLRRAGVNVITIVCASNGRTCGDWISGGRAALAARRGGYHDYTGERRHRVGRNSFWQRRGRPAMNQLISTTPFWSIPAGDVLQQLQTTQKGLTAAEAELRARRAEPHRHNTGKPRAFVLLLSQFTDPISLILLFSAGVSLFLQDATDAVIILIILFASGLLSFWQEYSASDSVQKLLARVQVTATALRAGAPQEIPLGGIVPGDMVVLHAGDLIPGDCLLLEAKDLFVDEAVLTGETYPAEKAVGVLPASTPLAQRKNTLFLGTHVISGEAQAVVIAVGTATEFGKISQSLKVRPPATEFERGIRHFGTLLLEITFLLVVSIFAINVYFHRSVLDSLLFALALAVGLTPQLLPAIISINLASGAKRMANQQVIVRRLNSIENFGSMNVLCSDKTGTLTEGVMKVRATLGPDEQPGEKVLLYGYLNASFQSGFPNPTDLAIQAYAREHLDISAYQKQDEIPYDFLRKRLTIVVRKDDHHLMVTKGAAANILEICTTAELAPGNVVGIVAAQA